MTSVTSTGALKIELSDKVGRDLFAPFSTYSGCVVFAAAFLTYWAMTIAGLPAGELLYMGAAGWSVLCVILNRSWPSPLVACNMFWALLIAQAVAFVAYVLSDLYCGSSPHDMARGWARMILLGIDLIAIAYLFGQSEKNVVISLFGSGAGAVLNALIFGPLFGDMWKFGVATPLCYLILFVAPMFGVTLVVVASIGFGVLNFILDFRSLGALCLLVGFATLLQVAPRRMKLWITPFGVAAALVAVVAVYGRTKEDAGRTARSDIERAAMIEAAYEAFVDSPIIGNGSWFSNTKVYDNFILIRYEVARLNGVGGFAGGNSDPEDVVFHSQILMALAEGGIFGGVFFMIYGVGLCWAMIHIVFVARWHRLHPLFMLILLTVFWDLFCSPFSGSSRVDIAVASGLVLMLWVRRRKAVLSREHEE